MRQLLVLALGCCLLVGCGGGDKIKMADSRDSAFDSKYKPNDKPVVSPALPKAPGGG